MLSDTEHKEVVMVCRHALMDIDMLLREGFDTNIKETTIDGVKQTVEELKNIIRKYNNKQKVKTCR